MKLAFVSCSSWSFKNKFLKVVVHLSLEIVCSLYMNHDVITSFFSSLKKKSHACLHKSLWKKQNETFICFIVVRKWAFLSLCPFCFSPSVCVCPSLCVQLQLWNKSFLSHCSCLISPWYNCTGWLGVKHPLTYFLFMPDAVNKIPLLPSNQAGPVDMSSCASSALQQTYKYIDRQVA